MKPFNATRPMIAVGLGCEIALHWLLDNCPRYSDNGVVWSGVIAVMVTVYSPFLLVTSNSWMRASPGPIVALNSWVVFFEGSEIPPQAAESSVRVTARIAEAASRIEAILA